MCCAMSLVCPSIATHRTCQFWELSEPVNIAKTRVSHQVWSAYCNLIPLFQNKRRGMLSSGIVLLHDNARPHTTDATKRLVKRFRWEVFDHPQSSARTWLSVIFISFFVWNGRRKTTFWHNELQISVENWLKAQAAGFYGEGIGNLVPGLHLRQHKHERRYTSFTHTFIRTTWIWKDDYDGQMIFGDLMGLNFLTFVLQVRKNPQKTSPRKLVPTEVEPGPAACQGACYRLLHSCGQYFLN